MTTITKPSVMQVAGMATKFYNADLVERIDQWDEDTYRSRMLTSSAETALQVDTSHEDDTNGTGEFQSEIINYRLGWSPDYEEALPNDARRELQSDVDGFVSMAWPYLAACGIGPEEAGYNFELSRNGHGAGFWDRGYKHGAELHELAKTFGSFGLEASGHGDELKITGHHG